MLCVLLVLSFTSLLHKVQAQSPAIQWQKLLGGSDGEGFNIVRQTADGGYILGGHTSSSNSGDVGANKGVFDIWVVKLDASGAVQWKKLLGGNDREEFKDIQTTKDGGYILVGNATSSNSGDVGTRNNDSGYPDIWVVKLNASGAVQWQKLLGGIADESAASVQQTTDGGYIFGGYTYSSNSGDVGTNRGSSDAWVVKLNASGAVQWHKTYGGAGTEKVSSIQKTSDGGYILLSLTESSNSGDVGLNHGNTDIWVVKLNASGVIQWQKVLGGEAAETSAGIQQTSDGGYILNGSTNWFNGYATSGDVGAGHGISDIWVVKLYPPCNFTPSVTGINSNCLGETISLKGSATTGSVQWSSVNPDIAVVSQSGVVTGIDGGSTDIIYTVKEGNCVVSASKSVSFSLVQSLDVIVTGGSRNGTATIKINNLPTGASSAIDNGVFTVGKTTYSDLPIGIYKVKVRLAGCTSEKEVNLAPNPCVTDNEPPKFSYCPTSPITVSQTGPCTPVRWSTPIASDNCYTPFVSSTSAPVINGNCFPLGKTTLIYTAQDAQTGTRKATCRFDVIVVPNCPNDNRPPVLDFCPNNRTVETKTGTTCAIATWSTPALTDNCSPPTLVLTSSPTTGLKSGSCFPIGTTTMAYTATNTNNLTTTCRFTVTVKAVATPQIDACANDVAPPIFANCPANIVISGGSGGRTISWGEPTASDNCVTPKVSFTTSPYEGNSGINGRYFTPNSKTTMIYTATDAKGLTAKCSFDVSMTPGKTPDCPPVQPFQFLYCPTNRLVEIPSSTCAVVNWVEPIKPRYQCTGAPVDFVSTPVANLQNGSCFPIGTTNLSYTTGTLGLSCRFTVTVNSTTPTGFDPNKCYRIVNKATGKVLEVKDASLADGAQIYQWASAASHKQQLWQIKKRSDGGYNIVAKSTGKLMDADNCTEGAIIKQFAADGTNSQNWAIELQTDGSYKILNQSCNKYIRVEGGNAADGHEVGIKNDFGATSFKWSFQEANCTTGAILSATPSTRGTFGFEARAAEGRAKLQWLTNTGDKTDYFTVERMNPQGRFDVLDRQNAFASNDTKYYTFTDNDPLDGDNFYRINTVFTNAPPQYSEVKKISFSKNEGLNIYPNPANDYITVDLRQYEGKSVSLYVYNSVGLLLKKAHFEKATAAPQRIDIEGFTTGSYLMRVQSEGKREVTRLFNIAK